MQKGRGRGGRLSSFGVREPGFPRWRSWWIRSHRAFLLRGVLTTEHRAHAELSSGKEQTTQKTRSLFGNHRSHKRHRRPETFRVRASAKAAPEFWWWPCFPFDPAESRACRIAGLHPGVSGSPMTSTLCPVCQTGIRAPLHLVK